MAVFVDAGYLIALDAEQDQHHAEAVGHWPGFLNTRPSLVTTNLVIAEVVNLFNGRGWHRKAVDIGRRVMMAGRLHVVYVDEELFRAGFDYLMARPDKQYSLTDCVSFVVMQRMRISEALAFDVHFEQAGFVRLPRSPKAEFKRTEI